MGLAPCSNRSWIVLQAISLLRDEYLRISHAKWKVVLPSLIQSQHAPATRCRRRSQLTAVHICSSLKQSLQDRQRSNSCCSDVKYELIANSGQDLTHRISGVLPVLSQSLIGTYSWSERGGERRCESTPYSSSSISTMLVRFFMHAVTDVKARRRRLGIVPKCSNECRYSFVRMFKRHSSPIGNLIPLAILTRCFSFVPRFWHACSKTFNTLKLPLLRVVSALARYHASFNALPHSVLLSSPKNLDCSHALRGENVSEETSYQKRHRIGTGIERKKLTWLCLLCNSTDSRQVARSQQCWPNAKLSFHLHRVRPGLIPLPLGRKQTGHNSPLHLIFNLSYISLRYLRLLLSQLPTPACCQSEFP